MRNGILSKMFLPYHKNNSNVNSSSFLDCSLLSEKINKQLVQRSRYKGAQKCIFFISAQKHILWVLISSASFSVQKHILSVLIRSPSQTLLTSTHNIYFYAEIRKISILFGEKGIIFRIPQTCGYSLEAPC